jgi:hypothetical protein
MGCAVTGRRWQAEKLVSRLSAAREMGQEKLVAIEKDGRAEVDDLGSKNDLVAPSGALKEEGRR